MGKRIARGLVVALIAVVFLSGCGAMTLTPATGFVYSDIRGPYHATSNEGFSKMGMSRARSILGLVALGDASIDAAMKNGNITKVHHVDYHSKNILSVYAELTVFVYGE
ncbi:MAG: TRL-like family protein [bacterium]